MFCMPGFYWVRGSPTDLWFSFWLFLFKITKTGVPIGDTFRGQAALGLSLSPLCPGPLGACLFEHGTHWRELVMTRQIAGMLIATLYIIYR